MCHLYSLQRGLGARVPELFRRMKDAALTVSLVTNDDLDDGWEGASMRRCVMSTSLCRMSVRLRKQRGLTTRNRGAKARCDCAPACGEVGKRGGDGTTRIRALHEPCTESRIRGCSGRRG